MKRLVLALVLALCGLAIAFWLGAPRLKGVVHQQLEKTIARAVGKPTRIQQMSLSAVPPALHVEGLIVGDEPSFAEVARLDLRLLAFASLEEFRPVLELDVDSVTLDVSRLPSPTVKAETTPRPGPMALRLQELVINDARVRFPLGKTVATVSVHHLNGHGVTTAVPGDVTAALEATTVSLQHGSYTTTFDTVDMDGGADPSGLFVRSAKLQGQQLTASVWTTGLHTHAIDASFEPAMLGVFVDELSWIGGRAQLEGTLDGSLANPVLSGTLRVDGAAIARHPLGDLTTEVKRNGTHLDFENFRIVGESGQLNGTVTMNIDREVPIHGDLTWQGIDLERMLGVVGVDVPFRNRFDATTKVDGGLDPLDIAVDGQGVLRSTSGPSEIQVADWHIGGRVRQHDLHSQLEVTQPQHN